MTWQHKSAFGLGLTFFLSYKLWSKGWFLLPCYLAWQLYKSLLNSITSGQLDMRYLLRAVFPSTLFCTRSSFLKSSQVKGVYFLELVPGSRSWGGHSIMAELVGLRKYAADSLCFSLFTTALCTTLFSLPLVHAYQKKKKKINIQVLFNIRRTIYRMLVRVKCAYKCYNEIIWTFNPQQLSVRIANNLGR